MSNQEILEKLKLKSITKQKVFNTSKEVFKEFKKCTKKLVNELNQDDSLSKNNVIVNFKETNEFEFKLQFSADVLIFHMHTNTFTFDKDHLIWKIPNIQKNHLDAYCGVINVYNFLNDSFKYNRLNDLGFLIGRIFINKNKNFFTDGNISVSPIDKFGENSINPQYFNQILKQLILYSIDFELLSPKIEEIQVASVNDIIRINNESKLKTAKKLGFKF